MVGCADSDPQTLIAENKVVVLVSIVGASAYR